jgi:hypothetical protein
LISFSTSLVDGAPHAAGETGGAPVRELVKGAVFWRKVERLLAEGVTQAGSRHDAVLTLCFAWGAAAGLDDRDTLARLVTWCGEHAHMGSRLAGSPQFTRECVREAAHYLAKRGPRWPFRGAGRGSAVSLGVLTANDRRVLELVDPRVRQEAGAVMAFLAGRADERGEVGDPVEWASGLAARLLGDRRVKEAGARRRAAVMAVEELARLGVISRYRGHAVGRCGRRWSVWYRFGSGELPARVTVLRSAWELAGRREGLRPTLYLHTRPEDAPKATPGELVELQEVGVRRVSGGVLRALSDGQTVRQVFDADRDVIAPARPGYRAAWWVRQWRGAPTVAEFFHAHEGAITVSPQVAARVAGQAPRRPVPPASTSAASAADLPSPACGSYDPAAPAAPAT